MAPIGAFRFSGSMSSLSRPACAHIFTPLCLSVALFVESRQELLTTGCFRAVALVAPPLIEHDFYGYPLFVAD